MKLVVGGVQSERCSPDGMKNAGDNSKVIPLGVIPQLSSTSSIDDLLAFQENNKNKNQPFELRYGFKVSVLCLCREWRVGCQWGP